MMYARLRRMIITKQYVSVCNSVREIRNAKTETAKCALNEKALHPKYALMHIPCCAYLNITHRKRIFNTRLRKKIRRFTMQPQTCKLHAGHNCRLNI